MCCMEPLRLALYRMYVFLVLSSTWRFVRHFLLDCKISLQQFYNHMLFKKKASNPDSRALDLPMTTSLWNGTKVIVDAMPDHRLNEVFKLMEAASSQRGEGFGANEYVSEEEFRSDIKGSHMFTVTNAGNGEVMAFFILAISRYSRGINVADPYIIVKPDFRGQEIGLFCLQLCVKYAKSLHFLGLYFDAFANNTASLKTVEKMGGFQKVGTLPAGGVMHDGEIVASVVYYMDLRDMKEEEEIEWDHLKGMMNSRTRRRSMMTDGFPQIR